MSSTDLRGFTVYDCLRNAGVPLRASARFGDGIAAALWERNETTRTEYAEPEHHTLSLYVEGGDEIRRRRGTSVIGGAGTGSLCVMPSGVTTDWDVSGPVRMFHLYVPRRAFDRIAVEALDADPASVTLRDATYFHDRYLETVIRAAVLPLDWNEPADRLAVSHAGQMLLAYLASRYTERGKTGAVRRALAARGGIAPAALRRVAEFVEANIDRPLAVGDLAMVAGLSTFHFARGFKRSTGESPHGFVLRRRIELAKALL
ncbi:MAG TPA: AraC family transcriptional regulator, partial [Stellaceae bacterium]